MVLAQGLKGDPATDDQLVVPLVIGESGEVEALGREQLDKSRHHPFGRLSKAFGAGVLSEGQEQVMYRPFRCDKVDGRGDADDPVRGAFGRPEGNRVAGHGDEIDQCWPGRTSFSFTCQTGWSPAVSTLKP